MHLLNITTFTYGRHTNLFCYKIPSASIFIALLLRTAPKGKVEEELVQENQWNWGTRLKEQALGRLPAQPALPAVHHPSHWALHALSAPLDLCIGRGKNQPWKKSMNTHHRETMAARKRQSKEGQTDKGMLCESTKRNYVLSLHEENSLSVII